jgi:hypothetical protein
MPRIALTPLANLLSVSTTPVVTVAKFATNVVDTGSNLPPVLLTPVANLPAVSTPVVPWQNLRLVLLIPVVHLDLRTSLRIKKKC